MAQTMLAARLRTNTGKEAAKKLRKSGKIPAVFYGPRTETLKLEVAAADLKTILQYGSGENTLLDLEVHSDDGATSKKAILKDLTIDPLSDVLIHADFYEISMDREITVNIPISLVNTPVGQEDGGILQQVRREVSVSCLPDKMVDSLEVDVSGLQIGDSLHLRDIEMPDGLTAIDEEHVTVAVVVAPALKEEEVEEEMSEEEIGEGEAEPEAESAEETK